MGGDNNYLGVHNMQNQNNAKQIAKQLIIDLAKSIPHQQRQNLLNLYIEVDRLECRVQQLESSPPVLNATPDNTYPADWTKRIHLRPNYTRPLHSKK